MFGKGSNLMKYAVGFALGAVGVPALKSGIAKKAYVYLTAGAFIARDSIMEEVEKTHAQALDIAEDAKILAEQYYAQKDKAYDAEQEKDANGDYREVKADGEEA